MAKRVATLPGGQSRHPGRGYWAAAAERFARNRAGLLGLLIVGGLLLLGLLGPILAPWDYRVQDLKVVVANRGPVPPLYPGHLLGTDSLGAEDWESTRKGTPSTKQADSRSESGLDETWYRIPDACRIVPCVPIWFRNDSLGHMRHMGQLA